MNNNYAPPAPPPPLSGGISKKMFVVGLVVAIVVSGFISLAVSSSNKGLGAPNYDSGWQPIAAGQTLTLNHNLGTTNLFVYCVGENSNGQTQWDYGFTALPDNSRYGLAWQYLTSTSISVTREPQDTSWDYVRIMIWII